MLVIHRTHRMVTRNTRFRETVFRSSKIDIGHGIGVFVEVKVIGSWRVLRRSVVDEVLVGMIGVMEVQILVL